MKSAHPFSHFVLLFSLNLLSTTSSLSHPGVGIVMDSKSNVYYTDLKHVWRIAPNGAKSIVVRNVHTHELSIDEKGNLYGEHLWYEGDVSRQWGHRVWRLGSDGTLIDLIPARKGFRDDYDDFHFVHDRSGAMYWADRGEPTIIRKRSPDGEVHTLATANFTNVRWMTVTSEGTLHLVDLHDLIRITPDGTVQTVVRNLANRRRSFLLTADIHAIMGLWTDTSGNVYAAVCSDRVVRKISLDGSIETAVRAQPGWTPSGGLVAPNGDLWLLENGGISSVRVRRIDWQGKSKVFD
ncbi:MAG: hypothetical protein HYZ01_02725 [Ignavibacteriales bacterium]|nr:hypothetical protein [Ignavibacteriales bacterium]